MSSRKRRFEQLLYSRERHVPLSYKEKEAIKDEEDQKGIEIDDVTGKKVKGGLGKEDETDLFSEDEEQEGATYSLQIKKVKSSKDKIEQPPLSEQGLIPRLGTSCIFNGTTGQGKSNLVTNLIRRKEFFGGTNPVTGKPWFDQKYLISPTAQGDDVQKRLGIPEENTFTDLEEAPELLSVILEENKQRIEETSNKEAPQLLVVYDDVVSHPKFLREKRFIQSFIASRHFNALVIICSQSWTAVPRKCRLQAKNIFFFASPLSEVELLCQQYCPPNMTKAQFFRMVDYATSEPYSFLYINKSEPMEKRFRKKLGEVINLNYFQSLDLGRNKQPKAGSRGRPQTSQLLQQHQTENSSTINSVVETSSAGVAEGGGERTTRSTRFGKVYNEWLQKKKG